MKSSTPSSAALALVSAAAIASSSSSCLVSAFLPPSSSGTNQNQNNMNTYASARTNAAAAASCTSLAFGVGGSDDLADLTPSARKKRAQKGDINPAHSMQQYLTSLLDLQELDVPPPSSTRTDLGSTVLVSGFVDPASPTLGKDSDQAIFDLLNVDTHPAEPDMFGLNFDRIVAFVPDAAFAKKRLVSRSARYSGLLNKLAFEQPAVASAPGSGIGIGLPTARQLEGVTSWVARIEGADRMGQIQSIAELARSSPSIANVAFLLTDASTVDMDAVLNVVQTMKDDAGLTKKSFTVVAVGATDDEVPEATYPYAVADLLSGDDAATGSSSSMDYSTTIPRSTNAAASAAGSVSAEATYSREESFRLVATCLGLECARNRALSFTAIDNVNATSYKLVKGLREAGYGWDQEVQFMIDGGAKVRSSLELLSLYVFFVDEFWFLTILAQWTCCNLQLLLYIHAFSIDIPHFYDPSPTHTMSLLIPLTIFHSPSNNNNHRTTTRPSRTTRLVTPRRSA